MSKKEQKIIINNTINNQADSKRNESTSGLNRLVAYITIIAGLIAIYSFFSEEINNFFNSDYDPKVEDVISE